MTTARNLALGIDIGGTKMALAIVERSGNIVAREQIPTEAAQGFGRAVERLLAAAHRLLGQANAHHGELAGIGIGCAGPLNPARGTIHNPYTLEGWDNCDIVSPLRAELGVETRLENDADVAALAEWHVGTGRGCSPLVMLTFGTGVGGAVLLDGQFYRGCAGEHPEIGHIPTDPAGEQCYCGARGCLELLAAGPAIHKAALAAGLPDGRTALVRAAAGDPQAVIIRDHVLAAVAQATWIILHTFLPQRIILGGGLMDEHYDLFAPVVQRTIASAEFLRRCHISVAKAALGNTAGVVGAAALAWQPRARHQV